MEKIELKIKNYEAIELIGILKECTYKDNTTALAILFVELEGVTQKLEEKRLGILKHFGGNKLEEYLLEISNNHNLENNTTNYSKECTEFINETNKAILEYLKIETKINIPKIDIDSLLKENKLNALQAGMLYKIFN